MNTPPIRNHEPKQHVIEEIAQEIGNLSDVSIEALKQGGLTQAQLVGVRKKMEEIEREATQLFGDALDPSDAKVKEFVKTQLSSLVNSVVETVKAQPADLIREAGLSEAVFGLKGDNRPILATDSLATCIGVAGYDRQNGFGFVVHFTTEAELEASGDKLFERIQAYRERDKEAPLLIHLRGGIKGMSEPLLDRVNAWLNSTDIKVIVVSEETLQEPIMPGVGLPKVAGSLKLNVNTGVCETYDYKQNPYTKHQETDLSEDNPTSLSEIFFHAATKQPEISIVYDPKNKPLPQ